MSQNKYQVREFFKQWAIYLKFLEHNALKHREVIEAYRTFLMNASIPGQGFNLLDLGCGDAHVMSRVLSNDVIDAYTGVDLSSMAMDFATKNLEFLSCEKRFIEDDMLGYLQNLKGRYNLIAAGYSVHHLSADEKQMFFDSAYRALEKAGWLIMHDVVRDDQECREHYIERQLKSYDIGICSEEEMKRVETHVREQDFPETTNTLLNMAKHAGFETSTLLYRDDERFYSVYAFQ